MPFAPTPAGLADDVVALEPLTTNHVESMWEAAQDGRETFTLTLVPSSLEATRAYVERHLAEQDKGTCLAFATRDVRTGRVVGGTRFMSIERWTWPENDPLRRTDGLPDALEIGSTWLTRSAQRTRINTHAKRLMLGRAFDEWRVHRVMLKTDARNVRSRAAIERLGARFDGVLRAHMPAFDGGIRDTAFYSILRAEWPAVRETLSARL